VIIIAAYEPIRELINVSFLGFNIFIREEK
jgi:hypothetical protein